MTQMEELEVAFYKNGSVNEVYERYDLSEDEKTRELKETDMKAPNKEELAKMEAMMIKSVKKIIKS